MDTQKLDQTYIANTYARFPVTIVKGKGSLVWDDTGKEYIDLSTGIAVDIFGVADEEWMAAVTKQLGTLQHISNLYYTEPCVKLAQMLCEKTGMKKVFFGNSGAEANECAIKAARKWSEEKKGKDYSTIITLKNSFHGRTITTLAATGQDVFHHDFLPLTEGFAYAEANNLDDLKAQVAALDRLEHEQRRCDLRDARGIELLVLVLGIEHAPARPVDEQGGLGLNIQRLVRVGQRRQTQEAHQHGKQKNRYNAANFHSSFSPSMV